MNITISLYRSETSNKSGIYKDYKVPFSHGMTVLDVCLYVYQHLDATFAFRYECRQGICGTCGVMLNQRPVLSCQTRINPRVNNTISPLANFPVEKDLIIDLVPVLEKFIKVKPYLDKIQEVRITKLKANESKPYRKCVECGCCIAGSDTMGKNIDDLLDPMSLVKIARFVTDPRDGANRKKLLANSNLDSYSPEELQRLTNLCPRGVPIDKALELLKRN